MNFKNILFIGFMLVLLFAVPVSFAADIDCADLNSTGDDLDYVLNYSESVGSDLSYSVDSDLGSSLVSDLNSNVNYIYVNGSYTGLYEYGTVDFPFKTINGAVDYILDDCSSCGNLFIADGDYTINGFMEIDKDMNIVGENSVSINCNNTFLFAFKDCIANISNIRIYNGYSDSEYTIIHGVGSDINLRNVVFADNYAISPGGILFIDSYGNLNLDNCSVINNLINYSGGISGGIIFCDDSNLNVNNSLFDNNTVLSESYGGGFIFVKNGDLNFINSKVTNVFVNATVVQAGVFYIRGNLNIINSDISSIFINGSSICGAFCYVISSNILDKMSIVNSSFRGGYFKDIYGLFYTTSGIVFDNVTVCDNYAEIIEGNLILYDLYNLSSTDGLKAFNNTFNEIGYNLSEVSTISYRNDAFILSEIDVANLPSSYDLRDYGLVTDVRNQGSSGCCWAFATYAALESYLLKQWNISYDLSENNMKNVMGKYGVNGSEWDPNNGGGNDILSLAYLLRWDGAVLESDDPFNAGSTRPIYGLDVAVHVQGVTYLPLRLNFTDNNQIKYALMKYGAIYVDTNAPTDFNYTGSDTQTPNHAIAIVGWDDNYSKDNFEYEAPGDGAFIIKNSWGDSVGDEGYYYVSYYAPSSIGFGINSRYSGFVFTDVENTTNYDSIYQYDLFGNDQCAVGFSSNEGWFANQFVANDKEILSAIGFYAYGISDYLMNIYVNDNLVHTQEGSVGVGYTTVKLNDVVGLNQGDIFKIVIKIVTPNYLYPIAVEDTRTDFLNATANPGESFISRDGENWIDLTDYYSNANVCLKAYTKSTSKVNVSINDFNTTYLDGVNLTAMVSSDDGICNGTLTFYVDGIEVATVNVVNGKAVYEYFAESAGIYSVDAVYNGDLFHKSSENSSNLYVGKASVSMAIIKTGKYYKSTYITVNLSKNITGNVTLKFSNGKTVNLVTSNGSVVYYIPYAVGTYSVNGTLVNDNYEGNSSLNAIKIYKATATVTASSLTTTYNSGKTLSIKVVSADKLPMVGVKLKLKVYTGTKYKTVTVTTDSKGIAKYDGSGLSIAKHKIIISSGESTSNMTMSSKTVYITVKKATVTIIAPVVKNKKGANQYFKVTIKNSASGKVISSLSFKITVYTGKAYKTYTVKTNSAGVASLNTKSLAIGTHKVVIKVATTYYSGSKSGNLIIITK